MRHLAVPFRGRMLGLPFRMFNGGGGAPAVTTLIEDAFTDTNSTALGSHTIAPTNVPGASWTNLIGSADIQSNRANLATYSGSISAAVVDVGIADFTASCIANTSAGNGASLIFRVQDSTHMWIAQIDESGNTFDLYEQNGGFTLRDQVSVTIDANADYSIGITVADTDIACTVDGSNSLEYTSALFQTETKVGFRGSSSATQRFDNFTVTTP